jgi:endonuclease/exonuclease/phosphatase (EEP) superfamily protein YafD
LNGALVAPLYCGRPRPAGDAKVYRAALSNVHTQSSEFARFVAWVKEARPDFIVVEEVDERWWAAMAELRRDYPYSLESLREDNFGIVFLSRRPLRAGQVFSTAGRGLPSTIAELDLDGAVLTVIGTHPLPPTGRDYFLHRRQHLQDIAARAARQTNPVLLLGDLNTTSWSPVFAELVRTSGLADSRQGFGLQPTWPTDLPFMLIPIDHCLASPTIIIRNRRTGPNIGSDHYPLIVDFSFGPAQQ